MQDGGPKCTPGVMKTIQWTLGASISGKPILSTSLTVEPTELIVPDGEEYFCVTQPCTPPGGKSVDPAKFVTKPNTPTILVEMWHNIPTGESYFEHIVDRILCHVQTRLASAPDAWYVESYASNPQSFYAISRFLNIPPTISPTSTYPL